MISLIHTSHPQPASLPPVNPMRLYQTKCVQASSSAFQCTILTKFNIDPSYPANLIQNTNSKLLQLILLCSFHFLTSSHCRGVSFCAGSPLHYIQSHLSLRRVISTHQDEMCVPALAEGRVPAAVAPDGYLHGDVSKLHRLAADSGQVSGWGRGLVGGQAERKEGDHRQWRSAHPGPSQ